MAKKSKLRYSAYLLMNSEFKPLCPLPFALFFRIPHSHFRIQFPLPYLASLLKRTILMVRRTIIISISVVIFLM
jgi:hypothetical protein